MPNKVVIIGLDSVPPSLLFSQLNNEMPTMQKFLASGFYGPLQSTLPPITVPAWASMMTSKNPGKLGLTGFRNRNWHSYDEGWIANSKHIREPMLWDILGKSGKYSCLLGIPQTYPPKPIHGTMVTGFLTPSTQSKHTYPESFRYELSDLIGTFKFDVDNYRTEERERILREIYEITRQHFTVAQYMITQKPWDFFMMVLMGPDRLHHGFWQFFDPKHRKYDPASPFASAISDYYRDLDQELARFLALLDPQTHILIVSDHGSKRMEGCFNVNDWLIQEGYLKIAEPMSGIKRLSQVNIDWHQTKAWAWGGYYARIFLNVRGREPQGIIEPEAFHATRNELVQKLLAIPDDRGAPMQNKIFCPEDVYKNPVKEVPDLMAFFGDLSWRATESIGNKNLYISQTEMNPDGSVHDWNGVFAMSGPKVKRRGEVALMSIYDVAPTVLSLFDLPIPTDMEGKKITYEG